MHAINFSVREVQDVRQHPHCTTLAAQVIGRVPGVLKLTAKEAEKDKAMFGEKGTATDVVATLEFEPPTHVRWSRFDASGKTSFITAFYCSPAGAALTFRVP